MSIPFATHPAKATDVPEDVAASADRRDLVLVATVFVCWRLGLLLVTYAGSEFYPLIANGGLGAIGDGQSFDFWLSWAQWDGGWFYSIAQSGYADPRGPAFFPLYPLLTRLVSYPVDSLLAAGLLLSNLAFLAFLLIFFRLVKERAGRDVALTATLTIIFFPTAYFGVAFYSESLFLLLAVSTFYFLRQGQLLPASAAAGLSAATRLVGVASFAVLAIYILRRWEWSRKHPGQIVAALVLAVLPLALYSLHMLQTFDDPLYHLQVASRWERTATDPITTTVRFFDTSGVPSLQRLLEPGALLLILAILALGVRKIPFDWWLFSLIVVLIPASSGLLMSMPRYVLASIGAFVILGHFLQDRTVLRLGVWSASLAFQLLLAVMYVNGHWTA